MRVPDDLAIIGSGNILGTNVTPIEITTIDPHYDRIGKTGATVLRQLIEGKQSEPFCHVVAPELIVKQSS